jgi:hypothetical protein
MLVGANDSAIEQQPFQVRVLEFPEDAFPSPLPGPAVESPPHAVPVAETFRQIPPGSPGFRDPEDCVDEQTIILGCDPGIALASRQKILDPIPVVIGDLVTSHDRPSLANLVRE